jgi:hypothetical protein
MNPKLKMKAELEEKFRLKYEEKLKEAKKEFARLLAEAHANYIVQLKMGMQQASDAALMAIDDVFDVNEYSAEKFYLAHVKYVNKISNLFIEDGNSDPEMVYSKTDIDRRLLQIVGAENFAPWDERYGGKNELCDH